MKTNSPPARISPASAEDIKHTPLFQGVAEEVIDILIPSSHICKLERNKRLYPIRDDEKYLYVIREGYFALRVHSEVLAWDNFLTWRGPGQILGEFALLFSEVQGGKLMETDDFKLLGLTGELKATEDCELLEIEGGALLNAAMMDPNIYRNISRLLIKKAIQEGKRSEVIQLTTVMMQVAKTLLVLIDERGYRPGDRKIIRGRIVHLDIAGYIGASRESVYTQMRELKRANVIADNGDGEIEILNVQRLRNESQLY